MNALKIQTSGITQKLLLPCLSQPYDQHNLPISYECSRGSIAAQPGVLVTTNVANIENYYTY